MPKSSTDDLLRRAAVVGISGSTLRIKAGNGVNIGVELDRTAARVLAIGLLNAAGVPQDERMVKAARKLPAEVTKTVSVLF